MDDRAYIKLSRKMLEWEWYTDINTKVLFLHMLFKANWKNGKFQGKEIPRGSFISSIAKLSEETCLTVDEVRTALKHLLQTGEVTKQTTNRYTVFSVVKYDLYQDTSQANPNQIPSSSQPITNPFPTIEERKEGNIYLSDRAKRFMEFWTAYPKQVNQQMAVQSYISLLGSIPSLTEEVLILAARNYAEACQIRCTQDRFIKNPENWLADGVWQDYVPEKYKKPSPPPEKQKAGNNRFNAFPQREYTEGQMQSLEQRLLNKNRGESG